MLKARNPLRSPIIRRVACADAAQACQVLIRPIREICAKDSKEQPS